MERRRFLGWGMGVAMTAGLPRVCGRGVTRADKIRIVSSLPRSGPAQGQTDTIVHGIRMAIDEYDGEVAGFKIFHDDRDDTRATSLQWDAETEATNAKAAAENPDCLVYIGPYNSGAAKVSMPILNEAGLLQISPACTWPGLTKKVPGAESNEPDVYRPTKTITFCRVCPHDFVQGLLAAKFANEKLKAKTVYILDDKEGYGSGIAAAFEKECKTLGVKVLGREGIDTAQQNFKTVLLAVAKRKPDLLYFGGTSQSKGPQIVADMKGVLDCPLLVPDGCYETAFIEGAGADTFKTVTCYATTGGVDPANLKGAGAKFVETYKEKYQNFPETYAVYGYEAAKVFLEAVKRVDKKDRDAIRKAVLATKDFEKGALSKWSFDADGDTTQMAMTVSKVEDGLFKPCHHFPG
jgi:branched-chain amino acid transport system substrate-binding protein